MNTKTTDTDKKILKKAMKAIREMPKTKTVEEFEKEAVQALRDAAAQVRGESQ